MLTISDDVSRYWEVFLELEAQAAQPYNSFTFVDEIECRAVRDILSASGNAEFSPPAARIVLEDDRCVGAIAFLSGAILRRRRLAGARALARADSSVVNEALKRRLSLASRALINPAPNDCYLSRLAVAIEARHRGLGSFLMDYVLAESQRQGFVRCSLIVEANNEPALTLYKRFGFKFVETLRVMDLERSLEHIHMEKVLN